MLLFLVFGELVSQLMLRFRVWKKNFSRSYVHISNLRKQNINVFYAPLDFSMQMGITKSASENLPVRCLTLAVISRKSDFKMYLEDTIGMVQDS